MRIAIASGKGGAGKTTLASNLASYLSVTQPVMLLDLDVEEPNAGLFLDIPSTDEIHAMRMVPHWISEKCTLCGKCQDVCRFHAILQLGEKMLVFPELCHSCFACSELCPENALPMQERQIGLIRSYNGPEYPFIDGKLNIGEEQAVTMIGQAKELASSKQATDEWLIIDAPPGNACPMVEAVADADIILLVAEPTPFGFHDFTLIVESLQVLGKDFALVVNKWDGESKELLDYCSRNAIPVAGLIHEDREIAKLYSEGKLSWLHIPHFENSLWEIENFLKGLRKPYL